jgi:hypothetical protein
MNEERVTVEREYLYLSVPSASCCRKAAAAPSTDAAWRISSKEPKGSAIRRWCEEHMRKEPSSCSSEQEGGPHQRSEFCN